MTLTLFPYTILKYLFWLAFKTVFAFIIHCVWEKKYIKVSNLEFFKKDSFKKKSSAEIRGIAVVEMATFEKNISQKK